MSVVMSHQVVRRVFCSGGGVWLEDQSTCKPGDQSKKSFRNSADLWVRPTAPSSKTLLARRVAFSLEQKWKVKIHHRLTFSTVFEPKFHGKQLQKSFPLSKHGSRGEKAQNG